MEVDTSASVLLDTLAKIAIPTSMTVSQEPVLLLLHVLISLMATTVAVLSITPERTAERSSPQIMIYILRMKESLQALLLLCLSN
jgi:hypothetical protein